ncbi:hypothetical protein [Renibacterium salmoninarum]
MHATNREASTELLIDLPAESNVTDLLLERVAADADAILYERKVDGVWTPVSAGEFSDQVRGLVIRTNCFGHCPRRLRRGDVQHPL